MAIAPLPQIEELELFENPWPKAEAQSPLRLVLDPCDRQPAMPRGAELLKLPLDRDLAGRRQLRSASRLRRRRLLVGMALLGFCVLMALPLRALGTVTVSGQQTPGGTPGGLMDGTPYVVQAGDSIPSIARQLSPSGNQAALVSAIQREVGSSVVVPGEHLILP